MAVLCIPILCMLEGMQLRVPSLPCHVLNLQLKYVMKYHCLRGKLLSVVCFFSVSSLCSVQTVLLASGRQAFMNVPGPLGKVLHEDQRDPRGEQQGTTLRGPPFAQAVCGIVNQAARGRRSGGRGEGGAHSSSLSASKPFAFQAQMQLKSDAWTAHTVRRGHALAVH